MAERHAAGVSGRAGKRCLHSEPSATTAPYACSRSVPIFGPLELPALERLARTAVPVWATAVSR